MMVSIIKGQPTTVRYNSSSILNSSVSYSSSSVSTSQPASVTSVNNMLLIWTDGYLSYATEGQLAFTKMVRNGGESVSEYRPASVFIRVDVDV